MTPEPTSTPEPPSAAETQSQGPMLSLDWWAVIVALALVLLVLIGVIPTVPW